MLSALETVDIQNTVIKMQSDIINSLFLLVMEHISSEEADALPIVAKINTVARLKARLEE